MNTTHTHVKPNIDFKYEPVSPRQKQRKRIYITELTFNIISTLLLFAFACVGIVTSIYFFFKWLSTYWL